MERLRPAHSPLSPELVDIPIYVIDKAAGQDIPRKRGPGLTRSDLLIVNKTDLAPHVGVDMALVEVDTLVARGATICYGAIALGQGSARGCGVSKTQKGAPSSEG